MGEDSGRAPPARRQRLHHLEMDPERGLFHLFSISDPIERLFRSIPKRFNLESASGEQMQNLCVDPSARQDSYSA
jgi:hypothetical protein